MIPVSHHIRNQHTLNFTDTISIFQTYRGEVINTVCRESSKFTPRLFAVQPLADYFVLTVNRN
jgi:hypothetical protein